MSASSYGEMLDWAEAEQPWAKLPLALVMDMEMTAADFRVYAAIDYLCGKRGQWFGPQAELVKRTGVTERQVRASTEKLVFKGYLLSERCGMARGTVLKYGIPARSDRNNSSGQTGTTLPVSPEQPFRSKDTDHDTDHDTEPSTRGRPTAAPKSLSNPKTAFGPEERKELREKYANHPSFDDAVSAAMNSPGYQFGRDKFGHVDRWLARDVKTFAERRNGHGKTRRADDDDPIARRIRFDEERERQSGLLPLRE